MKSKVKSNATSSFDTPTLGMLFKVYYNSWWNKIWNRGTGNFEIETGGLLINEHYKRILLILRETGLKSVKCRRERFEDRIYHKRYTSPELIQNK